MTDWTPAQIQTLGDLNFLARTTLVLQDGELNRLLQLAFALKAGTYRTWPERDPEPGHVLGLMAATKDVQTYQPNLQILTDFANDIGVGIKPLTRPYVEVTPAPAPTPTPEPVPTDASLADLQAKVAALEATVAKLTPGVGFPAGATVIEGDVIFKGRVGLGGLYDDSRSPLQLIGETSIMFANNFDLSNPDASGANFGVVSLSGDGGLRNLQNGYFSVREVDAYDPDGKRWFKSTQIWPNQTRPQVNVGPDSRGDWSLSKKMPPGYKGDDHEYTQDVVFRIDEDRKEAGFRLYRPGFKWVFGIDSKYGPEMFWTPTGYESRG